MKLNQKLIQQLRNGEIAAENNGTVEQLREVLKAAFPDAPHPKGRFIYYYLDTDCTHEWDYCDLIDLPVKSISDFYQPELFTGWAKSDEFPSWMAYFKDDIPMFGISGDGSKWYEQLRGRKYSQDRDNRPATHEEIEKALIKEAKRRGYKKWNYKCLELPRYTHDVADVFYYNEEENKLHHGKRGCGTNVVFKEGQWAEIVEQPEPKPQPKKSTAINYLVDGVEYSLDYQELKAKYQAVVNYSDEQFLDELPQIAHLACIVAYLKGLGVQAAISDKGIIHELIHLMTDPDEPTNDLQEIREKFNKLIQLV